MNEHIKSRNRWRAIVSIVMVTAACASFIISCVVAMILTGKD